MTDLLQSDHPYIPLLPISPTGDTTNPDGDNQCNRRQVENRAYTSLYAVAPLICHFIFAILTASFVVLLVDGHIFNTTLRRPYVTEADGSRAYLTGHLILQSDITTVLSAALVITRSAAGVWTTRVVWRCIFILMEKVGLSLRDINFMSTFHLPPLHTTWKCNMATIVVAVVLIPTFLTQFSAPLLTGSVTWVPSSRFIKGEALKNIYKSGDGDAWRGYRLYLEVVETMRLAGAAIADVAWGGDAGNTTAPAMKRVLPTAAYLSTGSILANVTVPYFAIRRLEWIKDPGTNLTRNQLLNAVVGAGPTTPFFAAGPFMALIPDSVEWGPSSDPTFPSPTVVSETRVLVAMHTQNPSPQPCTNRSGYLGMLPEDAGIYQQLSQNLNCLVYARVTYDAGSAYCAPCQISAPQLAQPEKETTLQLEADAMTSEALTLMPRLGTYMAIGGHSIIPNNHDNITEYVLELLPRSYAAAWTVLTTRIGESDLPLSSDVWISSPASKAIVLRWRVYTWVAMNVMLTLSGILSIVLQIGCEKQMVADTAMAALLLDTSRVLENDKRALCDLSKLTKEDSQIGTLKLTKKNGHRFVTLESQCNFN